MITLYNADCFEIYPQLPRDSIDVIFADPPYYKVKKESWDRQWNTVSEYIAWFERNLVEWQRILKPNGSVYCCASPKLAAQLEVKMGEYFNVLNRIVWNKGNLDIGGRHKGACKEALRNYFVATEYILFCEHFNSDSFVKGEAGYQRKCDELRGFIFEPLRAYLDGERIKANLTTDQCNVICGHRLSGGMAGRHYFSNSQFCFPTKANYTKLQQATGYFTRSYESLRTEYESLRTEYESLRRPFAVTKDVPYTDVWEFPTVQFYPGKHPCEKPLALVKHVLMVSSKVGATILDPFMGSGTTGVACVALNRDFIGVEKDPAYFAQAQARIDNQSLQLF